MSSQSADSRTLSARRRRRRKREIEEGRGVVKSDTNKVFVGLTKHILMQRLSRGGLGKHIAISLSHSVFSFHALVVLIGPAESSQLPA